MKEEILRVFKENTGNYVSGEVLSIALGVSRAAIWKHINQLKEEGYIFESSSKKGYKLIVSPDRLTCDEVKGFLTTNYIGQAIFHYDTINSTNNRAKELANEGCPEGTVVISEEQTAGKGRLGRNWVSPKGKGIWMSVVLRPKINPIYASKVTLIGAAAVYKAISALGISPSIKWPNDIVLNSKKVCGILTEMSAELNNIHYLIMGIGINVNLDQSDIPQDLERFATSLKIESGNFVDRKILFSAILNSFEDLYDEFRVDGSAKASIKICKDNSILLGKEIRIINAGMETKAMALDINEDGQLLIGTHDGRIETVYSGEVSARGIYGYV